MYRLWKENVFFRFFLRLGIILVVVTFTGFSLVSWYFERENEARVDAMIEREFGELEALLRGWEPEKPESGQRIASAVAALAAAPFVLEIAVTDAEGTRIFGAASDGLEEGTAALFRELTVEGAQEHNFCLVPAEGNDYTLLMVKRAPREGMLLKMALSLKAKMVPAKRQGMRGIVVGTAVILLLVVLATFPLIYRQYRELRRGKMALLQSNLDMVRALGAAAALRDSDTNLHNYRVTYYTIRLAEALNVEPAAFPGLITGAFLHDIGKIGIPDAVLRKAGALDADERRQIERHVELGRKMLASVSRMEEAMAVVAFHHERYDGGGYPHGTIGDAIPLAARIFAVADVFDALTSRRPYKAPRSLDASLAHIQEGAGSHFDPAVVATFLAIAETLYQETRDREETELGQLLEDAVTPYVQAMIAAIDG